MLEHSGRITRATLALLIRDVHDGGLDGWDTVYERALASRWQYDPTDRLKTLKNGNQDNCLNYLEGEKCVD